MADFLWTPGVSSSTEVEPATPRPFSLGTYLLVMFHDRSSRHFLRTLPGGALNADALRVNKKAQEFVRTIDEQQKPVAVICHGPWLLVSAGLVRAAS